MSAGRVALIVCAVAVVGVVGLAVLAIGAVTLLADSTEIASDDVVWQQYRDPDGRFQVDVPGVAEAETVEVPNGIGGTTEVETLNISNPDFIASVSVNEAAIAEGMTFAELPFSPEGAERGAEAAGFMDAELVHHTVLEGHGNTHMGLEMRGTNSGESAVMLSRLIVVGPDLYEVSVAGPLDQQAELAKIHDQLAESFRAPADA